MIYSGNAIKKLLQTNTITIEPAPEIKEASVKIHFADGFTIKPKEFLLSKSKETIKIPMHIAGFYDGYTHLARKGIITHLGSMFVDPGTDGQITFEVFNASDQVIAIKEGERAGHLIFMEVKE